MSETNRKQIISKAAGMRYEKQFFLEIQEAILDGWRVADNDRREDQSMRNFRGRVGKVVMYNTEIHAVQYDDTDSRTEAQIELEAEAVARAQEEAEAEAVARAQEEAEAENKERDEPEPEADPESEPEADPESEPEPEAEAKPKTKGRGRPPKNK